MNKLTVNPVEQRGIYLWRCLRSFRQSCGGMLILDI